MNLLFVPFVFNLILNTVLSFLTAAFLIEVFLFVFRIKNLKIRIYSRMVPLFKLFVDFLLYNFSHWALANQINPFLAKEGSRSLTICICSSPFPLTWMGFFVNDIFHFTPADLLYLYLGNSISYFLVILFLSITTLVYLFKGSLLLQPKQPVVLQKSRIKINNPLLISHLKKHRIQIKLSHFFHSPCITKIFDPLIIFPKSLQQDLQQKEIEAVIAHEISHVIFKDFYFRLFFQITSFIFWWVPKKWWIRKIEYEQELLCDENSLKLGVHPLDLAIALKKTLSFQFSKTACHFKSSYNIYNRLNFLLHQKKKRTYIRSILFLFPVVGILLGKLWIF